MLIANIDIEGGLVNGSRGVITKVNKSFPTVRFLNGMEFSIQAYTWKLYEDDKLWVEKTQIPLKLAYSTTIHKSQGSSLDHVKIDLGPSIFEYGQAYTALSRVRSLSGLSLINLDARKIKTHPKVKEFYKALLEQI